MKKCWCGNTQLKEYSENYYQCEKCHTLISKHNFEDAIYNVKNEDNDLYGKNYWEVEMTKAAGKNTLSEVVDMYLTERVIYWLQYILKYVKLGADIAEIGCGLGQLQYVMKRLGYNQMAFELSQEICNYMEKNLKIQTHCGSFEKAVNRYDGILAFDLFEHIMQPEEFLKNCAESLREEGVLCFQTPCYDPELTFEEMLRKKPKFEEQLKTEQHIYLYSRDSMIQILNKYGFKNIIFEPAYFGDDYDMFLFAAKNEIKTNNKDSIDEYLNSQEDGRLVKAMINLFISNKQLEKLYEKADLDRKERLKNSNALEKQLRESEADRAKREEEIEQLTAWLRESRADQDSRQKQIDQLTAALKESESDRSARLDQIKQLTDMVKKSEKECDARMEQIEHLTTMLKESEEDRAARAEQIDILTQMVKELQNEE